MKLLIFCTFFVFPSCLYSLTVLSEDIPSTLVFPPYLHTYGIRKATQTKLKMFLGIRASFSDPQGIVAVRMKSRDDTTTESDDDELTVYGVNSGRHQIIYNTSMYAIAAYGRKGSGRGQFMCPKGITANTEGDVYIADTENNRIVHLFNPKTTVKWVETFGKEGSRPAEFRRPEGIAIDSKGDLYVADTKNNRIQLLHANGKTKKIINGSGTHKLVLPTQLAVTDINTPWSYYRENAVFVIDKHGRRIQKFDFNGKCLAQIEHWPDGNVRYKYIALDFYNQVYVTDYISCRIVKFDRRLRPITTFGEKGKGDRQFIEPRGITIWRRYGQVFIAEKKGAQYYWLGTDSKKVKLRYKNKSISNISLFATEPSYLTVFFVYGQDTNVVMKKRRIWARTNRINFYVPQNSNNTGMIYIRMEPTYSSYTYIAKQIVRRFP